MFIEFDYGTNGSIDSTYRFTANGTSTYDPIMQVVTPCVGQWTTTGGATPGDPVNLDSACTNLGWGIYGNYPFFATSAVAGYRRACRWINGVTDQCPLLDSSDPGESEWVYAADTMYSSGRMAVALGDEDTEAMAEARALAAASAQDWTGPTSDSCQVASFRTDRGNTFSWSATQTQHRAQVPDYNPDNPDAEYEVDLWYVVTEGRMSDRWVTEGFHTVTKKPTRPGDNWTEWVDIPIPEVGLFAWHMGCRVRVHNSGS
jgi:hypothetical protein